MDSELVLTDASVYTAIVPVAVEMEGALSVHLREEQFNKFYLSLQHKE